jgi:hypothetical protein
MVCTFVYNSINFIWLYNNFITLLSTFDNFAWPSFYFLVLYRVNLHTTHTRTYIDPPIFSNATDSDKECALTTKFACIK